MCQLRRNLDALVASRWYRTLSVQCMWIVSQDEWPESTTDQAKTTSGKFLFDCCSFCGGISFFCLLPRAPVAVNQIILTKCFGKKRRKRACLSLGGLAPPAACAVVMCVAGLLIVIIIIVFFIFPWSVSRCPKISGRHLMPAHTNN